MKHLGDITKIHGGEVPIVDIITGGSPCQDLSVAGKRAGLDGERSGLFMDQVRIVKEMRSESKRRYAIHGTDYDIRCIKPRFMVWENVPGAFSSNQGRDFQAVLTEIVKIVCPNAPDVPLPKNGRWSKSGCLMGIGEDGFPFSVAYRLHDAQFWGVPQRRKRIALVADFGGTSAPEILFERKGVSRNSEQSGETREDSADTAQRCTRESDTISFQERSGKPGGVRESSSNTSEQEPSPHLTIKQSCSDVYGICSYDSNSMKSSNPHSGIYKAETSRTLDLNGGSPACNQGGMVVLEGNGSRPSHKGDGFNESETQYTLNGTEVHAVAYSQDAYDKYTEGDKSATIKQSGGVYGGGSECLVTQ